MGTPYTKKLFPVSLKLNCNYCPVFYLATIWLKIPRRPFLASFLPSFYSEHTKLEQVTCTCHRVSAPISPSTWTLIQISEWLFIHLARGLPSHPTVSVSPHGFLHSVYPPHNFRYLFTVWLHLLGWIPENKDFTCFVLASLFVLLTYPQCLEQHSFNKYLFNGWIRVWFWLSVLFYWTMV